MKIRGVLRDALRQKSVGIIEELPEKGLAKYGKPAGIVACIVPDDESGPHSGRQRDLRDQSARRRHLLAAPALEEDLVRNGPADARGAGTRGRARRHPAMPDQGQYPDVAGADGTRRPRPRHRWPADGPRRLRLGHARVWRRRRQLDDGHRRDCQHRGSGAQHAAFEDLRLRLRLFCRRQSDHRGEHLRQAAGAVADRGRLSRQRRRKGGAAPRDVGRRRASSARHRRHLAAAARAGSRYHDSRRSQIHHRARRRHRQGAPLLQREADDAARRSTSTAASIRRSR